MSKNPAKKRSQDAADGPNLGQFHGGKIRTENLTLNSMGKAWTIYIWTQTVSDCNIRQFHEMIAT